MLLISLETDFQVTQGDHVQKIKNGKKGNLCLTKNLFSSIKMHVITTTKNLIDPSLKKPNSYRLASSKFTFITIFAVQNFMKNLLHMLKQA